MRLKKNNTLVFIGDDTVAAKRRNSGLGNGFVRDVALMFPDLKIVNAGKPQDSIITLFDRLNQDCLQWDPDVVFIMVGASDVASLAGDVLSGTVESMLNFEDTYRRLLRKIENTSVKRVVLMEPFYVSRMRYNDHVRFDVNDKIYVVRKLAREFHCDYIALDGLMNDVALNKGMHRFVKPSGLVASDRGQKIIATAVVDKIKGWEFK